ncbi:hypothetical protein HUJ05_008043 [Dendroctonus ponderosae]|nr:hypothetical protein HUJ05_008043 [Dendroctonus ponderosae]
MAKGHSCDAEGRQIESSWVWYKSLIFLKNQVSSRKMRRNLSRSVEQTPVNEDSGTQSEIADDGEDVQPKQYCLATLESPNETQNLVAKRVRTNPEDAILDLEIKKLKMIESHMDKRANVVAEDDNYHFLISLKKPLSCLPMDRQMFVRYKIQELIYSEISNISKTPTFTTDVCS